MPEIPEQDGFIQALRTASQNFQNGNFASAEPIFRLAMRVCDPDKPDTQAYIQNLSDICISKGNVDEALRLNMRLLASQASQGASPQVASTMERVAALYERLGRLEEAEYLHGKAQSVMQRLVYAQNQDPRVQPQLAPSQPSIGEIVGPPPSWLRSAFSEANRQYGKPKFEIDPATVLSDFVSQPEIQVVDQKYRVETDEPDEFLGIYLPDAAPEPPPMRPNTSMGAPRQSEPEPEPEPEAPKSGQAQTVSQEDRFFGRTEGGAFNIAAKGKSAKKFGQFAREDEPPSGESSFSRGGRHEEAAADDLPELEGDEPKRGGRRAGPTSDKLRARSADGPRSSARHPGQMPEHPWAQTLRTLMERLAKVRIVLSRLADVLRQKKKPLGIGLAVCLGLGLIFGVYAYFFWPYPKPPAKTAIGVKFRSADNQKIVELIDDKVCDLSAGEDSARLPYRVYFFDFRNMLSMMLSPIVEKQIWIMRTQEGLLDGDSTTLYANDSAEMSLVQSVKSIGEEVASYYAQHKSYPKKVDFTYRNPFTKKIDKPNMQQLTLHGPHEIKVLYAKLLAGLPWPDEPTLYPGSINCCAVTIKTSANDVDIFVIQVADAHGFPISGSTDTSGYFYALEGGKEADLPLQPSLPQHGVQRTRRQVVWLVEEPLSRVQIDFLKHGASYICCSLAMFLFAFYKIFRPTGIIKYASIAATIFATIGFLLYGFIDYLPL